MIIASQKRKENIAEYLLYMWQIEDMIRANGLDLGKIRANVIDRFSSLTQQQRDEMAGWYESLVDMMRREGVERSGHLQINRNVMSSVSELHRALLADPRFAGYAALFYKTLPYIVELRSRQRHRCAGRDRDMFHGALRHDDDASCRQRDLARHCSGHFTHI